MVVDGLVLYGLHVWEKRVREAKAKILHEENDAKEVLKKASHATKIASREQQKAKGKKLKNQGKAYPNTVPKAHILQPDKTK
jgi:hypothetical protein